MSKTVPSSVKPSGGLVLPAIPSQPAPVAPATDRTLTYPLQSGGFLAVPCPAWCTKDHEQDLEGIHPADLCHEGDQISLSYRTMEGEETTLLAARIAQYPFALGDGSERPHMELMPAADDGESLGYLSAVEVHREIRRLERHLVAMQELAEKLAEACADSHAAYHRSLTELGRKPAPTWVSLRAEDVETMPVHYLLEAFDASVVEVEPDEVGIDGEISSVHPGDIVILLRRDLTQPLRERAVRRLLAQVHGGRA